jgi:hypothetical protein
MNRRITPAGRITAQNALKLSAWIAAQHPDLFRQLVTTVGALQRSPLGRLGLVGDDTDLTFTPDLPPIEIGSSVDYQSTAAYTPELADVSLSSVDTPPVGDFTDSITSAIAAPSTTVDVAAPPESGSFWSSIGSGAASAAGAIGKVASALVSPQSLVAAGGVAAAYFGMQGKTAQAQSQNAVLQAQLARVNSGAPPAGISYVRNPVTGAVTPVYNTANGQIPVTGPMLNSLSSPVLSGTIAGIPTSMLLIGGGVLVLAIALSARR